MAGLASLLRTLSICMLAVRLALVDARIDWAAGPLPAMLVSCAVAAAIVSEAYQWRRALLFVLATAAYTAWMLRDDGWRTDSFRASYALATLATAALGLVFVLQRNWRYSLVPVVPLVPLLLFMLLPGYASDVHYRYASWLVQLVCILVGHVAYEASCEDTREWEARHAPDDRED